MKRTEHTYTSRQQALWELDAILAEWVLDQLEGAVRNRHACLIKMGMDDYRVCICEMETGDFALGTKGYALW